MMAWVKRFTLPEQGKIEMAPCPVIKKKKKKKHVCPGSLGERGDQGCEESLISNETEEAQHWVLREQAVGRSTIPALRMGAQCWENR